jgi:hypothetical protein
MDVGQFGFDHKSARAPEGGVILAGEAGYQVGAYAGKRGRQSNTFDEPDDVVGRVGATHGLQHGGVHALYGKVEEAADGFTGRHGAEYIVIAYPGLKRPDPDSCTAFRGVIGNGYKEIGQPVPAVMVSGKVASGHDKFPVASVKELARSVPSLRKRARH